MSAQFWAIKYSEGFYTGTYLTRADAIADHVNGMFRFHASNKPGLKHGRKLNPEQLKDWDRCRRQGDRAVKVTVTEIEQ